MFVHVPQAHIVSYDWSVLLFNEGIKRSESRLAPVRGGGGSASFLMPQQQYPRAQERMGGWIQDRKIHSGKRYELGFMEALC